MSSFKIYMTVLFVCQLVFGFVLTVKGQLELSNNLYLCAITLILIVTYFTRKEN